VELIEALVGKGYDIKVYDRNVSLARLQGANRAYIEREIPHIATLMYSSMEEVLDASDVIVIGNKSPEFASVPHCLRRDQVVIDLVRISQDIEQLDARYEGVCW
jgi:GDP-mannose 6-dehydrogenase